jgi:hypothetical protein
MMNVISSWPRASRLLPALAAGIVVSRIPAVRYAAELNLDESQMMAQALRYQLDLIPWRAVDGTTSGPLNSWFLLAAHWLGMPLHYSAVHLLAALCLGVTVAAGYWAARNAFGRGAATIAAVSGALWMMLSQGRDFAHYSSEMVPSLLIAFALAAATVSTASDRSPTVRLLLVSLLLGSVPWAKLQAAPIAGVLGLWVVGKEWIDSPRQDRRWARMASLGSGALLPSLVILGLVWTGGAWDDFWSSYVVGGLYYAGHKSFSMFVYEGVLLAGGGALVGPWLMTVLAAGCWIVVRRWKGEIRRSRDLAVNDVGALLLVAAAWYVCAVPQYRFDHHQLLMVVPLMFLTAAVADLAWGPQLIWSGAPDARRRLGVCALAWATYAATQLFPAYREARKLVPTVSDASRVIALSRTVAPDFRTMGVWGWFPSLYVTLGQPPPTRHAISHYLYTDNPRKDVLQRSFMTDLAASAPDLMVEMHAGAERSYATNPAPFPALAEYLRDNYNLAWSGPAPLAVDTATMRIHVRKK